MVKTISREEAGEKKLYVTVGKSIDEKIQSRIKVFSK